MSKISVDVTIRTLTRENAFVNVVCEMAAILSWPQCVKHSRSVEVSCSCDHVELANTYHYKDGDTNEHKTEKSLFSFL